jgi:hypothetical protein
MQSDISKLEIPYEEIEVKKWRKCLAHIRKEAYFQIQRTEDLHERNLLLWWYFFTLFRNYLKAYGYGRLPLAKRIWAIVCAIRLGKNLAEKL